VGVDIIIQAWKDEGGKMKDERSEGEGKGVKRKSKIVNLSCLLMPIIDHGKFLCKLLFDKA